MVLIENQFYCLIRFMAGKGYRVAPGVWVSELAYLGLNTASLSSCVTLGKFCPFS